MAILPQVARCDAPKCGRLKQESNRWWVILRCHAHEGHIEIFPFDVWKALDDGQPPGKEARHYCGRGCLLEAVSELLEELQT